jgi:hypothetical protein
MSGSVPSRELESKLIAPRQRFIHPYVLWIIDTAPPLPYTRAQFPSLAVHAVNFSCSRETRAYAAVVIEGARQCRPPVPAFPSCLQQRQPP